MKKLSIFLASTTLLASCSFEQKPAPYEANQDYYGKNNSRTYADSSYAPTKKRSESRFGVEDKGAFSYSENNASDYNTQIDSYNSTNNKSIKSRQLGGSQPVTTQTQAAEVYPHQEETPPLGRGNSIISSKPLSSAPIDGEEQVVTVGAKQPAPVQLAANNGKPAIQPKITTAYDLQRMNNQPVAANVEEETIPPVGEKPGYLNLTQVSESRKVDDKLAKIRPIDKPDFVEEKEVAQPKPAPAPKVEEEDIPAVEAKAEEPAEPETPEVEEEKLAAPAKPVVEETAKVAAAPAPVTTTTTTTTTVKTAEKPKITPVIQRVETTNEPASGSIGKNTTTMMNKQAEEDEEEEIAMPPEKPAAVEKKAEAEKPAAEEKAEAPKSSKAFIKPVDGVVVSEFGNNKAGGGVNDGINIQAPEGTPVKASKGGTVVYSGNQLQGYGNLIIVRHPDGYLTAYSHLKELELKKGATVNQGDVLGHVGKTGNVETPQLHFGIRKGREPVDPKNYL